MKPTTREWVKKAEDDFRVASQILRHRKNVVPDAGCFHRQQCVEKYLKARLIEAGISFPRTHDLLQLLNDCRRPGIIAWRIDSFTGRELVLHFQQLPLRRRQRPERNAALELVADAGE